MQTKTAIKPPGYWLKDYNINHMPMLYK